MVITFMADYSRQDSRNKLYPLGHMQIQIEILTKKDCCLCDDAKKIIERVLPNFPATLTFIDIESDPDLFETYKEKIPVVRINGKESFIYKTHEITLRKKLEELIKE
jgi:hypothetical protein